jgi:hypothetical protein
VRPDAFTFDALEHQAIEDRLHQLHVFIGLTVWTSAGVIQGHWGASYDSVIFKTLSFLSQSQHWACCSSQRIFRQPLMNAPSGLLTRQE